MVKLKCSICNDKMDYPFAILFDNSGETDYYYLCSDCGYNLIVQVRERIILREVFDKKKKKMKFKRERN
jgi:DNA-directed RNA polymerase subunit RPC12/RpoP